MAVTYFQVDATNFGVVDDAANVPAGASIITQGAYDALLAAWQVQQDNDASSQLNQRKTDYTTVYAALRSMGMPQAAATLLAKGVGDTPAVDPELNVKPMTFASAPVTFTHALTGASGAFEDINEVADVTVTESGLYEVAWSIYGSALIEAEPASSTQTTVITFGAVFKNGVKIEGTECVPASALEGSTGAGVQTEPRLQVQGTAGGSQPVSLVAGDVLTIQGGRAFSGSVSTSSSIISNTNGRTSLSATRIRPA